jgi:hypothetical protein
VLCSTFGSATTTTTSTCRSSRPAPSGAAPSDLVIRRRRATATWLAVLGWAAMLVNLCCVNLVIARRTDHPPTVRRPPSWACSATAQPDAPGCSAASVSLHGAAVLVDRRVPRPRHPFTIHDATVRQCVL